MKTFKQLIEEKESNETSDQPVRTSSMKHKVHLRHGVNGTTACASLGIRNGMVIRNSRRSYHTIPYSATVNPEEFRATPAEDRCSHCCDRFTDVMNVRRALAGKPLYADAMTKTLK